MSLNADYGAWLRALVFWALAMLLALVLAGSAPGTALAQSDAPQRFSVEVVGKGPDVIFIPGLTTPRDVWRPTADQLANRYRVHLVQVRGFGEPAGANAQGPVLDDLVAELAAYIEAEGLEQPAIVGHSLGGLAALILGAEHPDLPGRLMIVDALPWYAAVFAPGQELSMAMVEPQAAALRDGMLAQVGQPVDQAAALANAANQSLTEEGRARVAAWSGQADQRVTAQLFYEDITRDMREGIAAITAPVTVLVPHAPPYPTQEIAMPFYTGEYEALAGVELVPIGPSRHFIMLDAPAAFMAELEAFLAPGG